MSRHHLTRVMGGVAACVAFGLAGVAAAQVAPQPEYLRNIARLHSPILLHEIDPFSLLEPSCDPPLSACSKPIESYDHILPVDFDGNTIGADNTDHARDGVVTNGAPVVYYSIVETGTSSDNGYFFIGYWWYHPHDAGSTVWATGLPFVSTGAHQHDLEGAFLVVKKTPFDPAGRIVVGLTAAHGVLLPYKVLNDQEIVGSNDPCCDFVSFFHGPQTSGWGGAINFWPDPWPGGVEDHPVVAISARKHAPYMAGDCGPGGFVVGHQNANLPGKFGIKPVSSSAWVYTSCIHKDRNAVIYSAERQFAPPAVRLGPWVQNGMWTYRLVRLEESPLWQLKSIRGLLTGELLTLDGGERGLNFFAPEAGRDAKAEPPWSWVGGSGCMDIIYETAAWYDFGKDNTTHNDRCDAYPVRSSPRGSLITNPAAEVAFRFRKTSTGVTWIPGLDLPTIYNPYRPGAPGYPPPPPPPPLTAWIDGPDFVLASDLHTWYARVSGGTAPYTYQWSGAFSAPYSNVTASLVQDSMIYLDVYDAAGGHVAVSKFVTVGPVNPCPPWPENCQ